MTQKMKFYKMEERWFFRFLKKISIFVSVIETSPFASRFYLEREFFRLAI